MVMIHDVSIFMAVSSSQSFICHLLLIINRKSPISLMFGEQRHKIEHAQLHSGSQTRNVPAGVMVGSNGHSAVPLRITFFPMCYDFMVCLEVVVLRYYSVLNISLWLSVASTCSYSLLHSLCSVQFQTGVFHHVLLVSCFVLQLRFPACLIYHPNVLQLCLSNDRHPPCVFNSFCSPVCLLCICSLSCLCPFLAQL